MAISSPPLPALSPLSTLFSQERRRRRKIELKALCNSRLPPNPQPKIKRQNHLRKKLSNTKFSGDFSANQTNQAALEVLIDDISNTHLVVSNEIDNPRFSEGGAKEAALQMHMEESSNSQILVSPVVKSNQISSEIDGCSRKNGMVSKQVDQLEGLVGEEEGIDPFGAPTFGLALRIGALFLAQTLFAVVFFGLGGFLRDRREEKNKKKREKIVEGEVRDRVVMDELEYASMVTEIRAMASLVKERERDVEARERGSRDRKKDLHREGSLNLDSYVDIGKKEPNSVGEIESLQSDFGNGKDTNQFEEFGNKHVNVSSLD